MEKYEVVMQRHDLAFAVYSPPDCAVIELPVAPRLESWDKRGHPSQVALAQYLSSVKPLVQPAIDAQPGRLALELEVGFGPGMALTGGGRDLDNYLLPIVRSLGAEKFLSVWGRKVHGHRSTVRAGPARLRAPDELSGWSFARVLSRSSATTTAWKEEVHDQIGRQVRSSPGRDGLDVQICFRVSPDRNWSMLWKPAIDACGPILGEGGRPFHPKDDRILVLGLHRVVDSTIGWSAGMGVWWRAHSSSPDSHRRWPD